MAGRPVRLRRTGARWRRAAKAGARGGGPLWRQPSAVSHEVYTECRRLELLGDPSVVPLLRATLAKVPVHAKGSKRCIKMCIDALSPEPPEGEREPVEPLEYGARTRPSKGR